MKRPDVAVDEHGAASALSSSPASTQTRAAHCWLDVIHETIALLRPGVGKHGAQEIARAVLVERGQQPQLAVAGDRVAAARRDQQRLAHLELGADVVAVRGAADVAVDLGGERDVVRPALADARPACATSRGTPVASSAGWMSSPSRE